ncbi:hypothetical protein Sjap_002891 [Stephania japonica]|uniref:Uncharacterized protein n=1 Tax=Stephania japonica TaxID=461633 RepID=A0AAP0PT15_9MAGN
MLFVPTLFVGSQAQDIELARKLWDFSLSLMHGMGSRFLVQSEFRNQGVGVNLSSSFVL